MANTQPAEAGPAPAAPGPRVPQGGTAEPGGAAEETSFWTLGLLLSAACKARLFGCNSGGQGSVCRGCLAVGPPPWGFLRFAFMIACIFHSLLGALSDFPPPEAVGSVRGCGWSFI